ncbi:MAG: threonine/serine exporter family protein [Evtepia sp.]
MVSLQQGALQIFCGALGTLGFALFFFVRPKHLLLATLGGALSWLIYLLVLHGGGGVFLAALVSSMAVCFWSEALARVRKAPALIFLLPGIVPQLPGGALYYSDERPDPRRYGHVFSKRGRKRGWWPWGSGSVF